MPVQHFSGDRTATTSAVGKGDGERNDDHDCAVVGRG